MPADFEKGSEINLNEITHTLGTGEISGGGNMGSGSITTGLLDRLGWHIVDGQSSLLVAAAMVGSSLLSIVYFYGQIGLLLGLAMTVLSHYGTIFSLQLLLHASRECGTRNYEMLGFFLFGSAGAAAVEISTIVLQFGTAVAYLTILQEIAFSLENTLLGGASTHISQFLNFCFAISLIPQALIRDTHRLARAAEIAMFIYAVLVLTMLLAFCNVFVAFLIDPSPNFALNENAREVSTNSINIGSSYLLINLESSNIFRVLPIICQAYTCQSELFSLYQEVGSSNVSDTMAKSVKISTLLYVLIGLSGFFVLGVKSMDPIWPTLSEYLPTVSILVQVALFVVTLVTFPLAIIPCRQSLDSFLYVKRSAIGIHDGGAPIPYFRYVSESMIILALCGYTAVMVPSVETVVAMTGATAGVTIAYILPCLFFLRVSEKTDRRRLTAQIILGLTIILAVASTFSLLTANVGQTPKQPNELVEIQNKPRLAEIDPPLVEQAANAAPTPTVAATVPVVVKAPDKTDVEFKKPNAVPTDVQIKHPPQSKIHVEDKPVNSTHVANNSSATN